MSKKVKIHYRFTLQEIASLLEGLDRMSKVSDPELADQYSELLIKVGDGLMAWILEADDGSRET